MTVHSSRLTDTTMQWEVVGAWQAGTVVDVALTNKGGIVRGLLASGAGAFGWIQPEANITPLPQGMSDLHVVSVAFAGGDATTPAVALAATATGRLFRSSYNAESLDAGQWREISQWAGLGVAVVLTSSPAFDDDHTLFIGTSTGIFRTQDDGQSWESCNFGLLDEDVLCLACAPNFAESEVLWAGTAGGGLYRSRNRARAWRESGNGLPDAAVQCLAVSPNYAEDRTVYVGMEAHGVYVSRDGGENWNALALAGQSVNTLACPRSDLLWAGTEDGLWRVALDRGEAEQVTGAGEAVLSVAATTTGQVAAGLFGGGILLAREDAGEAHTNDWHRPDGAFHAPPVVTKIGPNLFAMDSDGLLAHSNDAGAVWVEFLAASSMLYSVAGAPVAREDNAQELMLFAADEEGIARWHGEQSSWQPIAPETFRNQTPYLIDLSPTFGKDQTMLAGTLDSIFISQDGGTTWSPRVGPWQGKRLLRVQFAPTSASEIVALTVQPSESGHYDVTVWHSADLGQSWETLAGLSSGVPAVMTMWPEDDVERALFLATQHRVIKLYRQGDPPELQVHQYFFDESLRVTALAAAPDYAQSPVLWAATTRGLYSSPDCGLNWAQMLALPLDLPIVWLDVTSTHVNAITLGGRVWRAALPKG